MDVDAAMGTARAMRYFRSEPVPDDMVVRLTWAATRASSAHNSEPWEIIVVRDRVVREEIAEDADAVRRHDPLPAASSTSDARIEAGVRNLLANMAAAPVYVFICARNSYPHQRPNDKHMWSAVGGAAQNMLVAARAVGLGVAPTMFHVLAEPRIREILGLPDDVVLGVTALVGWPAHPFGPLARRPLDEVVHHDRW